MKKSTLPIVAIAASFCCGFAFKTIFAKHTSDQAEIRKATGIAA